MTEVDEETRGFLDRLLRETVEGRHRMEQKLDAFDQKIEGMNDRMLTNFDALYKRDEDRKIEYQAIKAALSRVEVSIAHLQLSLARLSRIFASSASRCSSFMMRFAKFARG
jgi:hypothetical protein